MQKELLVKFFNELEIYEDIANGKNYKEVILKSLLDFLNNSNDENAKLVYEIFFQAYWIGIQEKDNPFIEMIEKMKVYESNGGRIITKQRDHFIHSVHVFILGICIYIENNKIKNAMYDFVKKSNYRDFYTTNHEEFLYRWGIASLSHDIAYPIEILLDQLKEYSKFLNSYSINDDNLNLTINFNNMDKFNELETLKINPIYEEEFNEKNKDVDLKEYIYCTNIFSKIISERFHIDYNILRDELNKKIIIMEEGQYIDHGFYSGVIILKWYHALIKKTGWNPSYFIYPIIDIATSILLHNMYSKWLMRPPISLDKLSVNESPIAFMLILCDELQEWDRLSFSKNKIDTGVDIKINGNNIDLIYISDNVDLIKKETKIKSILSTEEVLQITILLKEGGEKYE